MRLTTDLWLSAWRLRCETAGVFLHVVHRGDPTAGDVLVKVSFMDGRASLWSRAPLADPDAIGPAPFVEEVAAMDEREVDAVVARRRGRDRDLWVVEVEDRHGRHLLET
ncbi:MAG: DUF1491 family protein [Pseudomonadota bacterium]